MSEIVATGDTAASPRNPQIVDVPAYVPPEPTKAEEAPKPTATPDDEGQSPDDAAAKDGDAKADEATGEEPKKRNGYKEKLERERQRTADLEAQLAAAKPKEEPKAAEAEKEPKPEDFETWDAYYKANAKYEARQEFARLETEKQTKAREASLKNEFADKQKNYAAKADEFKTTVTDFDDVINSYDGPLTAPMQQALLDSDLGPQIAYYVAQHPEEGEAMAKMGVLALNKAIGKIEAKLESNTVSTAPTKEVKITKAPAPIKPVGKSSTNSSYDPHSSKGGDDHEEYMKWRAKNR